MRQRRIIVRCIALQPNTTNYVVSAVIIPMPRLQISVLFVLCFLTHHCLPPRSWEGGTEPTAIPCSLCAITPHPTLLPVSFLHTSPKRQSLLVASDGDPFMHARNSVVSVVCVMGASIVSPPPEWSDSITEESVKQKSHAACASEEHPYGEFWRNS
jgi:hypothetical protein